MGREFEWAHEGLHLAYSRVSAESRPTSAGAPFYLKRLQTPGDAVGASPGARAKPIFPRVVAQLAP
jgi:hypothetical protein